MTRVLAAFFIVTYTCLLRAGAQPPDPGRELDAIEATERGEDPLGIDESTRELAKTVIPAPKPVLPAPQQGAALSSIPGVGERRHAVRIELDHGLASVTVELSFVSTARHAAQIAYRLPLARGARLLALSDGVEASEIDDARGHALALRMGPITSELTVSVRYVVEAPLHGGRARFQLAGRGYDPNLAPSEISVSSRTLALDREADQLDPWLPFEVVGTLHERDVAAAPVGHCKRHYRATPLAPPVLRPTTLYVDASPSMEGPARSRLTPALVALLTVLPEATPLHALAFAARSQELGRYEAGSAPLLTLSDAALLDLGAATKLGPLDASGRVIVLSDGSFDDARKLGPDSWLVLLADGAPSPLFAHTLNVSAEAEAALHGDVGPLEDRLRAIVAAGSGEQQVVMPPCAPKAFARPPPSGGIAAIPYVDVPPPPPAAFTGMPRESVLSMLRTQLVPQARACLRSDRKGRGDYAVALTFEAVFAQREVYEPRVRGTIPRPLRECLLALLPRLHVPAFTGRIRVRYPIFTEREQAEPAIELEPDTRQQLERAFGSAKALP